MEENQEKINQANETNTTELTDSNININNEKIITENVDTTNNTKNNENQQKNEIAYTKKKKNCRFPFRNGTGTGSFSFVIR